MNCEDIWYFGKTTTVHQLLCHSDVMASAEVQNCITWIELHQNKHCISLYRTASVGTEPQKQWQKLHLQELYELEKNIINGCRHCTITNKERIASPGLLVLLG
jgi:hypothetical protein